MQLRSRAAHDERRTLSEGTGFASVPRRTSDKRIGFSIPETQWLTTYSMEAWGSTGAPEGTWRPVRERQRFAAAQRRGASTVGVGLGLAATGVGMGEVCKRVDVSRVRSPARADTSGDAA